MAMCRLESFVTPARGTYDEDAAELTLWIPGTDIKGRYDETEVDRLLAVCEVAADPTEDLAEFFTDVFGPWAYRVAQLVFIKDQMLATLIYA